MWTGSAYSNIKMRRASKKKGFTMSQYGIKDKDGNNLTKFMSEKQIFEFLGMTYVEPNKR